MHWITEIKYRTMKSVKFKVWMRSIERMSRNQRYSPRERTTDQQGCQ